MTRFHQLRALARLAALVLGAQLAVAPPALAHEFWLEPVNYRPKARDHVPIVFRTGQNLLGDSFPYLAAGARRFSIIDSKGERAIKAIEGDDPAGEAPVPNAGLAIVVFESGLNELMFETMPAFEESVKFELLDHIVAEHRRLGKPEVKIRETYVRSAKALVNVGRGGGNDRAVGLPLEIIAERNPYELKPGEALGVRVLYRGQPISGLTLKVFNLKDTQSPRRVPLDKDGRAQIELPIKGEYLIHTVHVFEPEPGVAAEWSSLWASLTFVRP